MENNLNKDLPSKLDKSDFINFHKNISPDKHKRAIEEASIVIIYSAAAVGSSSVLLFVPNLETITLFIFLVSFLFGLRVGFSMMLTTVVVFELFASMVYGFAGFLLIFKIISYSLVVVVGSSLNPLIQSSIYFSKKNRLLIGFLFSLFGFVFTLLFDIITSLDRLIILQDIEIYIIFFVAGIPFYIFHQLTNSVLFFFIPEYIKIIQLTNNEYFVV